MIIEKNIVSIKNQANYFKSLFESKIFEGPYKILYEIQLEIVRIFLSFLLLQIIIIFIRHMRIYSRRISETIYKSYFRRIAD